MQNFRKFLPIVLIIFLMGMFFITSCSNSDAGKKSEVVKYEKGYRFNQNGWIYIHIEGKPFERGFQHGYLAGKEIAEIVDHLKFLTFFETGKTWEFFVKASQKVFMKHMDKEILQEMKGIAAGATKAGFPVTWQEVLTWNGYEEIVGYWWPNEKEGAYSKPNIDHCSGFIATGSATKNGKIVMAHNSWDGYETGQYLNVILDIVPEKGSRMFMQSAPGYICSFTDYFVTSAGLMGTETTIGDFGLYDPNEVPEFVRIRRAMQYATNLDQFVNIMKKKNNGGYANTWLVGDEKTGEVMRFELGLKYSSVKRTKDGCFVGFNAVYDPKIRNLECTTGSAFFDVREPGGARRVRLTQLMQENYGQIDIEIGKKILADHYDVYLKKNNPGSRSIEGHYELDPFEYWHGRLPFQPLGAVDGKVCDSDMAKKMSFWARWGNSSGMPFDAKKYLEEHPQWNYLDGYLKDRPTQPWTVFKAGE